MDSKLADAVILRPIAEFDLVVPMVELASTRFAIRLDGDRVGVEVLLRPLARSRPNVALNGRTTRKPLV